MSSANSVSRVSGFAAALGVCCALSCPAVACADSQDSNGHSHAVGHAKAAERASAPARGRVPKAAQPDRARTRVTPAAVAPIARAKPALAARKLNPLESVVSAVLGAFGFNPRTDAGLPFGTAVVAWVRREFTHTLSNKAPTIVYDPTSNRLTTGGAITGNIGASDPEGDPLSYTVTQQPISGTVTVDSQGTFVYTPDEPMQPGDSVQFVVAVIDRGMNLHGIDSLLSPQTASTTKATITVDAIDAGLPQLGISDATATEPGRGQVGGGFWHTSGNQILDAAGNPVQIAGVNWFGFEGTNGVPDGLWTRNYKDMMDQMVEEGFNTIRLPYSEDVLHGQTPTNINYAENPDLQGLTSIQVMDKIIDYAGQIGLKVILDHHRNGAGVGTTENGLWYDTKYSETEWVNDWVTLTQRYATNPTVIGVDLHNEPYNGTWGGGGANDWARAAERAGNAVLAVNPNLLIIVEGVGVYNDQYYWWGGNLMGVKDRPIVLNVPNRVVYSPHDYPNSLYAQPWFSGNDFGAALPAAFDNAWGYIYKDDIAPVYLGEFGTSVTDPKDAIWYQAITSYLSSGISWTYWAWNANAGDMGGILADDWTTVNQTRMVYLRPLEFHLGDETGTSTAQFTVTLASASTKTVTVQYATSAGTATEGSDFVGAFGTVTFLPGDTSKTVTVTVLGDSAAENNETFIVALSSPTNATLTDATGVGTIVDQASV